DVWYDEHNLGSGALMDVIQHELGLRRVVVLILSRAAFASRWVRREVVWADELLGRDSSRLLIPITAGLITRNDFSPETGWLFLHDYKRIEAAGYQPYPPEEAIHRLLRILALVAMPESERHLEDANEALVRAKALNIQGRISAGVIVLRECVLR